MFKEIRQKYQEDMEKQSKCDKLINMQFHDKPIQQAIVDPLEKDEEKIQEPIPTISYEDQKKTLSRLQKRKLTKLQQKTEERRQKQQDLENLKKQEKKKKE